MLDFNPPELKDKLKSAINEFNFVDGEVEEVEFKTILDEDSYHEYDNTITNSSEVVLFVGDEGASLSVDTFIKMYDEAEFIKINKAQSYACTKDEIFYLLDVSDYDAFMLMEHLKSIENPNVVQDKFANLYWKSEKKISKIRLKQVPATLNSMELDRHQRHTDRIFQFLILRTNQQFLM